MEEYSYTSTHPLGHTGPVMGSRYFFTLVNSVINKLFRHKYRFSSDTKILEGRTGDF